MVSLAIRYGVTVESILRANNLISSDLDTCEYRQLVIPTSNDIIINRDELTDQLQNSVEKHRRALVKTFKKRKRCDSNLAHYYLNQSNWNIDNALIQYSQDIAFESTAQFTRPYTRSTSLQQNWEIEESIFSL